jgi:dihydroflavonol-4-reductase
VPETIFVTGGTGMVGANLTRRLMEEGHTVRLLTRGRQHPLLDGLAIEQVRSSLQDEETLLSAMQGCSQVYHVAGLVSYRRSDTQLLHDTNVAGTRSVLAAALRAGVKRVVHTSSTAAIGYTDSADRILDESTPFDARFRRDPYMWTKHLAESEVAAAVQRGLDVVMVNPSTIYGAGDINRNTTAIFSSLQRGRMFAAPPGGTSVVSVDDVVSGMLLAMQRGKSGRRYILSAERLSYVELFSRIAMVLNVPPVSRTLPTSFRLPFAAIASLASALVPGAPVSSQVVHFSFGYRYFTSARAESELGWRSRVTIDEAIRAAYAFMNDSGAI